MVEFDRRVSLVCARNGVAYTRYADDLTFSAKESNQLAEVEAAVFDICARLKSPSLIINETKTVRLSKRDSRRVTGLVLTNDRRISLGRDVKRLIRAQVHHYATNRLDSEETSKLRGMLNYVNSVEPAFLQRLAERYGSEIVTRLRGGQ